MSETTRQPQLLLLDLLFDDPAVGHCLVAPNGKVLRANAEWLRSTGLSLEEVLGSKADEIFPREMALAVHAPARSGHRVEVPRHARQVNGRETWWEGTISPVDMDAGKGLLITVREVGFAPHEDATARLAAIVESSDDAIVSKDVDGIVLTWNPAAERLFGYRADEVIGRSIEVIIPPERRDEERGILARVGAGERVARLETERLTKQGVRLDVVVTVTPVRDRSGRIAAASKIARDITRQRRAERVLREAEGRYRELFDSIDEGFCVIDVVFDEAGHPNDYVFLEVNAAFERQTGLQNVVGRRMRELAPSHEEHWFERYGRIASTGEPARFESYARALGRWFDVYAFRTGNPERRRVAALFNDITNRKRTEDWLRQKEERLRLALAASRGGTFDWDPTTNANHWSEELLALYGMRPDEFGGRYEDWIACLVPEDRDAGSAALRRALEVGDFALEFRIRRRDTGEIRWMHGRGQVSFDPEGQPVRMVGLNVDVTERMRAEEALRESEQRYRTLFTNMTEGFALGQVICDEAGLPRDFQLIEMNDAFEQQTGLVRESTRNRPFREVLPELEQSWIDTYGAVALGGPARRFESYNRDLDRHFSLYCFSPERGRFAVLFSDISERKRMEQSLGDALDRYERQVRLLDGIASTTPDFVYVFDRQGRFLYANRRLLEVWGMQLSDVIGKTPRELGYEQWHHDMHMREIAQVIETKRPIKGEVPFKAPLTGIFGVYEYIFAPVIGLDGSVETIAGTTRDVTDRKRAEDALRDADRQKTEFLGVLSHELRNPLAPIRNSIFLLERAPPGSEQATLAKAVVRRQAEHLTRLVDDLLDITRISRGKIALQRATIDLREVVRKTTDDLLSVFGKADVALHVDYGTHGPIWIDADATRMAQVLGNLLQNAVKFTPNGGSVRVSVEASGDGAQLCVRDDGAGMEPNTIDHMFEPFAQASQTLSRARGGLGLGLALVKGIVEMHGGSVYARSEGPGRGSEFRVNIPIACAPADAGPEPELVANVNGAHKVILIIEDNIDAADSLAEILRMYGHRVSLARDGRTGLALAHELGPDVILCDIGLPDLDGYEVARSLRRDEALGATRLVALSGYAQPEDRQRAREVGFDAHMAKPPDVDKLISILGER